MANLYDLIPEIPEFQGNWVVQLTVTEILPPLVQRENRTIQRYILADSQGNEMLASVYGDNVLALGPRMEQFAVLQISNVRVVPSCRPFEIVAQSKEWILNEHTMVRRISNAIPNSVALFRNILPMSQVETALQQGDCRVNVMGIIIRSSNRITHKAAHGHRTLQRFTIIDHGNIPRVLTLWDDMINVVGGRLKNAKENSSVVVCRRVKISPFAGGSLSANTNTAFVINPGGLAAEALTVWFEDVCEEMMPIWFSI